MDEKQITKQNEKKNNKRVAKIYTEHCVIDRFVGIDGRIGIDNNSQLKSTRLTFLAAHPTAYLQNVKYGAFITESRQR